MRQTFRHTLVAGSLAAMLIGSMGMARAQGADEEEDLGWSGETDLNLVVAKGNADSQTFGLDSKLKHHWKPGGFARLSLYVAVKISGQKLYQSNKPKSYDWQM